MTNNLRRLLIPSLLLLLTACTSQTERKDVSKPCLTTHGIHSAKQMGLAESDWEVPPEHICGPGQN